VKNDGGTVKVQSTDLIVDGNLSVSGSLFLQDRDLAEYEDRVSSLENAKYEERVAYLESVIQSHASALAGMSGSSASPPKCIPPGGDKLRFDGEKWICVCINSYYYGDECQYKTPYEPVTDDNIRAECFRCLGVSLHGLCYDSPHGPMPDWNVSLVTEMHDLFSHYFYCKNANDNICKFMTWANVDISKWNTERVTNMYNMFYYASAFNQDIGGWNTAQVTTMQNMFFEASAFNHYIGDWDTSKLRSYSNIFRDATAFQAKYTCASSSSYSSYSVKPSSCKTVRSTWIAPPPPPSPPLPPPPPLSPPTDSVNVLSWPSLGTSLVDEKHQMEIETLGGSVQYDASEDAIVANGWTGSLDFSSLRTDRSGDVEVRYEVYVPANNGPSADENGWWYTITIGENGNSVTGDNFSWLHKKDTGGKICAHVPWGGNDSCVEGKSFADYTNRWIQLGMRRPAGENRVIYYIDGEQVIDYKPSNDITSDGILSKLYVFIQPWEDSGQPHLAETGVKIRNLEIKWD